MSGERAHARLDVGRAIRETFLAIGDQPLALALLGFAGAGLPSLLFSILGRTAQAEAPLTWFLITYAVGLATGSLTQAPMIAVAVGGLTGRPVPPAECLRIALRKGPPLFAVSLVATLATTAGLLLLVVPGLILMAAWFVAPAVIVCERGGLVQTLRRAAELSRGQRWRILLAFLLIILIAALAGFVAGSVIAFFLMIPQAMGASIAWARAFMTAIYTTIGVVVGVCALAAVYMQLREVKDGAGADALAAVFD